jgi:hypothetical protein|tara:strand:- start:63 stop:773 length:711 start_codon:yes stop_codon:yes gene_type:complete
MYKFWCVFIPRFFLAYFFIAIALAAYFYPGGNHLDSSQIGYDFTANFLSELGFYRTLSNEINFISAFFFNSAMYLNLLVGFGFLMTPKLFNENIYSLVCSWIGAISIFIACIFFAGVGLTPADLYFPEHIFAVQNAFNLVILAYIFVSLAFLFSTSSNKYTIGTIIMVFVTIAYAVYISGQPVIDPINQKELFYEKISMSDLRTNVVLQKTVTLSMNISLLIFSFGFADLIKRKGL